jgi:hypothetical protein
LPRAANGAGKRAEKGGLQARSPKKAEAEGALPMKRLALPLVLLMSLALFGVLTASAQTTTTYTLTTPLPTFNIPPYNGTTMQGYPEGRENFYPFRAFNIPFEVTESDGTVQNLEVNQISGAGNTACYGQSTPAEGFIFITLSDGTNLPCASAADVTVTNANGTTSTLPGWAQEGSVTTHGCAGPADVKMNFRNEDPATVRFSGSTTLNLAYYYSPGGGGRAGGGAGCYKVITGGTLTLTQ